MNGVDATAANPNKGSAYAIVSGGTLPYVISWSTGDTLPAIQDLKAGLSYSASVIDANDCQIVDSIYIAEFVCSSLNQGVFHVAVSEGTLCDPSSEIQIQVGTGAPTTLLFSIDQGQTYQESPSFPDLAPGEYHPIVIDAEIGCILSLDAVSIDAATWPELSIIDPSSCTNIDGQIINNSASFEIALDSLGPWSADQISNLSHGQYEVWGRNMDSACIFFMTNMVLGSAIAESDLIITTRDATCDQELGTIQIVPSTDDILFRISSNGEWYQSTQIFSSVSG